MVSTEDFHSQNLVLFSSGPYQWRDAKKPRYILDKIARSKPQWLSSTQVVVDGELHRLEDFGELECCKGTKHP